MGIMLASAGSELGNSRRVLIVVQNLPVPFDRRVWQEARTLKANGYKVSIICPKTKDYNASYESIDGIHIYRHSLPIEARNALGYALEYGCSLIGEFYLAWKVFFAQGFDVIHACNPPDTIFLIGGFFKFFFGTKFVFDHHDINPELYEAKFGRKGFFYYVMLLLERLTFWTADISIATNNSYRAIALERGKMPADKVFVVRSGPALERMKIKPPAPSLKKGKSFLVGYVGVMGQQEGIQYLILAARFIVRELKREDIHFILVGGGPALQEMQELAKTMAVDDYFTFTGRISDAELLEVLNTADVCVNPDEVNPMNNKSTMNKIMEYMALAKPIVQFDVTEGKFSAENASLYAKANDAQDFARKIIELMDSPTLRDEMGQAGRKRVENELAWHYEAPKLLAAYDTVFAIDSWHNKLAWYYHRLRAMSGPEILYRISEVMQKIMDRYTGMNLVPPARDSGALPQLPGLREGIEAWQIPAELTKQWEMLAEQVSSGNIALLGKSWPTFKGYPEWHRDPVTGKLWPQNQYCFAIDYRHTHDFGDIKYVWELNRLQFLQPLAVFAFKRKDSALAKYCLGTIENWIDHNPPHAGVHWASGIELALRVVSIIVVTTLLGEHLTQQQRGKIWGTLAAHALWIERYPSKFSSANNHAAAEALGLFIIGTLYPHYTSATHWKEQGWKNLCETSRTLILADGAGAEQSLAYTAFTLEMLLLGQYVARSAGVFVPNYYTERLILAGECLRWFTDANNNQPRIGDDDNGCVLGISSDGSYVSSIMECIAAISGQSDLSPARSVPHLRQAFFGIPPVQIGALMGLRSFDKGGYTIGRHRVNGLNILLAIDHGPLGFLSIAAHGHADALSVWLHIDDQPVLVDAGTYLFHSDSKERNAFRSTSAHNTLCIAEVDSSIIAGNFNWSHKAKARLNASGFDDKHWWVEAEHDGYLRRFKTIHRRRLNVRPTEGFSVEDVLIGLSPQPVEIGFLIHPSLEVQQKAENIVILKEEKIILRIKHVSSLTCKIVSHDYSASFGQKEQTKRIVFSGTLLPDEKAITHFFFSAA